MNWDPGQWWRNKLLEDARRGKVTFNAEGDVDIGPLQWGAQITKDDVKEAMGVGEFQRARSRGDEIFIDADDAGIDLDSDDFRPSNISATRRKVRDAKAQKVLEDEITALHSQYGSGDLVMPGNKQGKTQLLGQLRNQQQNEWTRSSPTYQRLISNDETAKTNQANQHTIALGQLTNQTNELIASNDLARQQLKARGDELALARADAKAERLETRLANQEMRELDLQIRQMDINAKRAMHAEEIALRREEREEKKGEDLEKFLLSLGAAFLA